MMRTKNYPLYKVEPFENFKDMLDKACAAAGNEAAYRFNENGGVRDVSYYEFRRTTQALGTALCSLGINSEHIAMVGENCYDWICTYLTVLCSNAVYVPIDKDLPFEEIIHIINSSDSEVVFFTEKFEQKFRDNVKQLPSVKYFIGYGIEPSAKDKKFLSAYQLIEKGKELMNAGDRSYIDAVPDDSALRMIVYTSGTTGNAKGVMLTQHNLVSCVYYGMQVSGVYTTSLSVLPYHHTYEAVCDILVSLHNHSTVCINESLKSVLVNLKKFKPDYIMLVPLFVETIYKKVWKTIDETGKTKLIKRVMKVSNNLRRVNLDYRRKLFAAVHEAFGGNLKKIVSGGAPIRPEMAEFFDAIGINLVNGYGITECSPLVSANRDNYNDFRSVGVVLPCCRIKIENPNEDGEGEICVRGDTVMKGYYKAPEATAAVLSPDGWFNTGDYGKTEGDLLFITGRKKNLIVLKNGKNVYPEEIEEYVKSIPDVCEVVVYSIKNEDGDETGLCAEIYPESDFLRSKSDEEKLAYFKEKIAALNQKLPSYKHIGSVKIRSTEFEKTTSRKIKRTGIGQ